jgi:hypothetical protein
MKRYSGYLIIGSETKSIEVIADSINPDSTCVTRFHKKVTEVRFELVAQYPSDRLVIDSIEEINNN